MTASRRLVKGFVRKMLGHAGYEVRRIATMTNGPAEQATVQLQEALAHQQAEQAELRRAAAASQKDLSHFQRIVEVLVRRHYLDLPLPPEELREHVGVNTRAANFMAQGINSSSRVLEIFGEQPAGPVLDWGCGSGRTWRWLMAYPQWRERYRGCDVDGQAVAWLHGLEGTAGVTAQVAVCNDLPPLTYADGEFIGLFAFSVLTHIHPHRHRIWYEELHRVLKPGGQAYLTTKGKSTARLLSAASQAEFAATNCCFSRCEGHYKDVAVAGEAFTRRALEGLFRVEHYQELGYQDMDAFLIRRAG